MARSNILLFTVVLLTFPILSMSHWWFMSQVYALGAKIMCNNIAGLVNDQRQLCRDKPDLMISIGKGAKLGVEECQKQFKDQRWNCSTVARDVSVFGKVTRKASRESAFVYAISSAGVVHEVTRACSRGEIPDCTCDKNKQGRSRKGFEWGGCSDNIAYGLKFAKLFVDSREQQSDARAKMNLHNNFVGRRAVKSHTLLDCKCHGVSGSCQVKTCWKTMSKFGVVGDYLRQKYHNGILVTVDQSGNELVVAEAMYPRKPAREDLVFLEESPDYCVPNTNTGSLGTTGRYCNKTSLGHGSCGVLCCGRGFNTIQIEQEFKCGCKFQWCCHVRCNTCRKTVDKHMCKSPEENDHVRGSSLQFSSDSVVRKESNKQNKQSSSRSGGKRIDRRRKAKKNRNNQRRGSPSPIDNTVDGGDHRDTS
ncbi:protein Wnt-2b-A-like [Acropora millepora]|uniref:protein Wnt-2b-A-like n=1 Tax=Acropora millepora TaxID=45264 RepID=UPI0010FCBEC3|nr:protein Wnt-2b-A-like [Acropora millepora]